MKYIQVCCMIGLMAATIAGCRSTKTITTAIAKKDTVQVIPVVDSRNDSMRFIHEVLDTVKKNRIDFKTFSAKVKVNFESANGKKNDFNAFINLKKDSLCWISINAAFGLEAFRVLVTPDSVKVLNKLDKVAQLRSVESMQEVIKIPLHFQELQDLLVGNAIFLDSNISSYKIEGRTISLVSIGALFKHFLTVNKDDYTLQHSKLDDVDALRARTADIIYDDYQVKNGIRFSTYRRITVVEKGKVDIEMQFKQFDFNKDLSFPFRIPQNYKRN